MKPLAWVGEVFALRRRAMDLLDTYVGSRAGERILAGQIRRGHSESMHAAIWLSDLRGFTALSDRLDPKAVVEILNQYFDRQVSTILSHEGEIPKFMGDGLLAMFPVCSDRSDLTKLCSNALQAAYEARTNVSALKYAAESTIERFSFGLALHVVEV